MGKIYDWQKVQQHYDTSGCSTRDLKKVFGVCENAIFKARKRGEFKSRDRSSARKLACKNKPQKHTEETKKKISRIRIKYLTEHPDKVPYLLNHHSKGDSYPEKYFEKVFKNEDIPLRKKLQIRLYELDFYNLEHKIDVEIDGNQHYCDLRIVESDKRRTQWLEGLGWKVIRIRWSDYVKMSLEHKSEFIQQLKKQIIELMT